jgi:hypothetical protein
VGIEVQEADAEASGAELLERIRTAAHPIPAPRPTG